MKNRKKRIRAVIERIPIKFLSFETKMRRKTLILLLAILGFILYFCFVHSWHYDKKSGIKCGGQPIQVNK